MDAVELDDPAAVTLAIAKKLKAELESRLNIEVLLTRETDVYMPLEQRTAMASVENADLFISVHCNAAPSKTLRGIETYTLNTSSNRYSIRLAARENATTERGVGDQEDADHDRRAPRVGDASRCTCTRGGRSRAPALRATGRAGA